MNAPIILLLLGMAIAPAPGEPEPAEATKAEAAAPAEGLWPSPKLLNQMLRRWAVEVGEQHKLNDEQRKKVEKAVVERWTGFLNENRTDLQPLLNEFIELRMELEPPEKERVQQWAGRSIPVFQKVREQMNQGMSEFREMLTPIQRAKFELEAMTFGAGMEFAEQRLKQWEKGDFDAKEFWEPPRSDRRSQREARRREREAEEERQAALPTETETDQIALELTTWEEYVARFIETYGLDEAQRGTVLSCLSEMKARAAAHRDRHKADIDRLERRIKDHTGSDQELEEIKKQLTELYGPVDEMFLELKNRIDQVPTTDQRSHVAEKNALTQPRP